VKTFGRFLHIVASSTKRIFSGRIFQQAIVRPTLSSWFTSDTRTAAEARHGSVTRNVHRRAGLSNAEQTAGLSKVASAQKVGDLALDVRFAGREILRREVHELWHLSREAGDIVLGENRSAAPLRACPRRSTWPITRRRGADGQGP